MKTNCPVCYEDYNLSTRLPRITRVCGHSFCSSCLTNIIKGQDIPKCPLDKIELPIESDIEKFPINYPLRDIIEEKLQTDVCPDHGEQFIYFCLVDHERICDICLEEQHQEHRVRSFKTIKVQAEKQTKELGKLSRKAKESCKEADLIIQNRRETHFKIIDENYDDLVQIFQYKRQCLKSQAHLLLYLEKCKIESLLGENSALFQDISTQEQSLQNLLQQKAPLKYDASSLPIKNLEDKYQAIVDSDIMTLSVDIELELLQKSFLSENLALSLNIPKLEKLFRVFRVNSSFDFSYNESCLVARMSDNLKPAEINLDTWKEAQEIVFSFTKEIKEDDLALITVIWDSFKALSSLKLKFTNSTLTKDLCCMFCSSQHRFKKIEIDVSGCNIDEQSPIIPLIRNTFLKAKNIEVINLIMKNVTGTSIEKIFKGGIFDTTNLREFSLNLFRSKIIDKDISDVFVQMPRLVKLVISLGESNISDETPISCAKNTLLSASKLENFEIGLSDTRITDKGAAHIFKSLRSKNLTELDLKFKSTGITDQTIELLSDIMSSLSLYDCLEAFIMGFSCTQVTEKSLVKLFMPMSKLRKLGFGVQGIEIADQTIYQFIEAFLQPKTPLDEFSLAGGDTKLTDKGFSQILARLNNIKKISLLLENALITDNTLELFIDELLSPKNVCRNLYVNLAGTKITERLKQKFGEAIEQISKRNVN